MSEGLAQLHFLRPSWLWALLALPLLAVWWQLQRRRADLWRRHVDAHLLPHLLDAATSRRGQAGLMARMLALLLAVLALAGPSWRQGEALMQPGGRGLVLALDLSDAMLAGDLPPSRLAQARSSLGALLRAQAGGDVGLIAFSEDAYAVAPLTDDSANVMIFLDALAPEVMPVDGHRADRAIDAAVRLFEQAGYARGDILLLAHGANEAAVASAARASASGFRVLVLGLGKPAGATYRARDGSLQSSRLDSAALRRVAAAGGGAYAALTGDTRDLSALGLLAGGVAAGDGPAQAHADLRSWRDDGYWLLLPLMLLALLAFRRGAVLAAVVVVMLLPMPTLQAAEPVSGTAWRRADQVAHARMREGLEAYRAGRYDDAERAWRDLRDADAAYNRGNALARAGRYEDAMHAYDEALRQQPAMEDAIANRSAVEAALQRQPPAGAGSQPPRQGGEGAAGKPTPGAGETSPPRSEQTPEDTAQGESPGAGGVPRQPQEAGSESTASPAAPTAPVDPATRGSEARAQHDADQAQRQRMQQALARNGPQVRDGQTIEGEPERAETETERERRQAGEAWLRRVPDDPGGLLRARFRLEYERRNGRRDAP